MRPIRLLILLLAITLALVLTLMRPIQGRATRAAKRHRAHAVKIVHRVHRAEPRHHQFAHRRHLSHVFGTRVVSYARHFIGIPYRYGGSTPGGGFDCSGLVRFVYRHFGIALPHSSYSDLSYGHRVSRRSLRPGDLVFFYGAGHVGIYVGGGRFIDAPHTGARVRISTMGAYSGYYSARRFRAS
jgi:cell wall-associated NlpC family hydrolase